MLKKLTSFLLDAYEWLANLIMGFCVDLINMIISALADFLIFIINLLPEIQRVDMVRPSSMTAFLGQLNWLLPISDMVSCLGLLATAYIAYFIIRPLLKLVQLT